MPHRALQLFVQEVFEDISIFQGANHVGELAEPLVEAEWVLVGVPDDVVELDRTQARHSGVDWLSLFSYYEYEVNLRSGSVCFVRSDDTERVRETIDMYRFDVVADQVVHVAGAVKLSDWIGYLEVVVDDVELSDGPPALD